MTNPKPLADVAKWHRQRECSYHGLDVNTMGGDSGYRGNADLHRSMAETCEAAMRVTDAARDVITAFESLGEASSFLSSHIARTDCEKTMSALKTAIDAQVTP